VSKRVWNWVAVAVALVGLTLVGYLLWVSFWWLALVPGVVLGGPTLLAFHWETRPAAPRGLGGRIALLLVSLWWTTLAALLGAAAGIVVGTLLGVLTLLLDGAVSGHDLTLAMGIGGTVPGAVLFWRAYWRRFRAHWASGSATSTASAVCQ
jgi:hypothetical protein